MRFFNKTSIKSIISILKKNLNLILMFAILILVILIITKHMREGAALSFPFTKSGPDADYDPPERRDGETRETTQDKAGIPKRNRPTDAERVAEDTDERQINRIKDVNSKGLTKEQKDELREDEQRTQKTWQGKNARAGNKQSAKTYTGGRWKGPRDRADNMPTKPTKPTRRRDRRAGGGAAARSNWGSTRGPP